MKEDKTPFSREIYIRNAKIYRILANHIRLEILNTIKNNEATVDELSTKLGIKKANTSQHLAILRYTKLVKVRREGQRSYYSIVDPRIIEPCRILKELWKE